MTSIIAEIGLNHMGDPKYARAYLASLSSIPTLDAVTFQVREPAFYAGDTEKALVLSNEDYREIFGFARKANPKMQIGIALSDLSKLEMFEFLGTDFYKVLSRDMNDYGLVKALVETGKPVWVSTGLASEDEIGELSAKFCRAKNLALIHTQLSYAAADTNLRAISGLRERYNRPIAFGLHAIDGSALFASLAFEPTALFIYVKGGRHIDHRDESHAIDLADMRRLVESIRRTEVMLGDGVKKGMANTIPDQQ